LIETSRVGVREIKRTKGLASNGNPVRTKHDNDATALTNFEHGVLDADVVSKASTLRLIEVGTSLWVVSIYGIIKRGE
jgi:hypothetical protein